MKASHFRTFAIMFLVFLVQTKTKATLSENFDHTYIANTPWGWIGTADWTELAGEPGIQHAAPYPERTQSHIYFGFVDFYLPGKALFWLWIGPLLMCLPLFGSAALTLKISKTSHGSRILFCGLLGFYYGVVLAFLGSFEYSKIAAFFAGSPLSIIQIEAGPLYWSAIGVISTSLKGRVQGRVLLALVTLHYLAFGWAFSVGVTSSEKLRSLGLIWHRYPVWLFIWAVLLFAGEFYVWLKIVRSYRKKPGKSV